MRYNVPIRYLSIHVLHTVPVHAPVRYTSTELVTGSGTAGTDTLCSGTKRYQTVSLLYRVSIAFVPGQYHFCTGSVSFLYRVSIAFVLGQCCFCIPRKCRLLLYQSTQAHAMYAYLTFIIDKNCISCQMFTILK